MNITTVGSNYVGLVNSTCFAELGVNVTCVDPDAQKTNRLIYGDMPIYEPGLEAMITRNVNEGRLKFTLDYEQAFKQADVVFCAIESSLDKDGGTDLKPVLDVAKTFAQNVQDYSVFVIKTTVPVGTALQVKQLIADQIAARRADIKFDVASDPDFLTEGNAIKNFMSPDRIILGVDSAEALDTLKRLYRPILLHTPRTIFTDPSSAEMIKYAATAMLASRISLMNEIANLCEVVGADANVVRQGVGTDSRIGPKYIYPGCGYGGTLFSQDVRDMINLADVNEYDMEVLRAVDQVNSTQKRILFEKLSRSFNGEIEGRTVAVWGLSFKPETDDMSEGPAITTLDLLLKAGCKVRVYDPVTMNVAKLRWREIYCGEDMYDTVKGADALLLVTEWRQFHLPAWDRVKELMRTPLVIDGRNIYDANELQQLGFSYHCIGK